MSYIKCRLFFALFIVLLFTTQMANANGTIPIADALEHKKKPLSPTKKALKEIVDASGIPLDSVERCRSIGIRFGKNAGDKEEKNLSAQCMTMFYDSRIVLSADVVAYQREHFKKIKECQTSVAKIKTAECNAVLAGLYAHMAADRVGDEVTKYFVLAQDACKTKLSYGQAQDDEANAIKKGQAMSTDTKAYLRCVISNYSSKIRSIFNHKSRMPVYRASEIICKTLAKSNTGDKFEKCFDTLSKARNQNKKVISVDEVLKKYTPHGKAKKWCDQFGLKKTDWEAYRECVAMKLILIHKQKSP